MFQKKILKFVHHSPTVPSADVCYIAIRLFPGVNLRSSCYQFLQFTDESNVRYFSLRNEFQQDNRWYRWVLSKGVQS